MVSEARTIPLEREREGESNHPENVSLTIPRQGVLPRQRHLLPQQLSMQKCMEENSLKLHGKGQIFGMLRLALIPAIAGTRAPLSKTGLKHFGKLKLLSRTPC